MSMNSFHENEILRFFLNFIQQNISPISSVSFKNLFDRSFLIKLTHFEKTVAIVNFSNPLRYAKNQNPTLKLKNELLLAPFSCKVKIKKRKLSISCGMRIANEFRRKIKPHKQEKVREEKFCSFPF